MEQKEYGLSKKSFFKKKRGESLKPPAAAACSKRGPQDFETTFSKVDNAEKLRFSLILSRRPPLASSQQVYERDSNLQKIQII